MVGLRELNKFNPIQPICLTPVIRPRRVVPYSFGYEPTQLQGDVYMDLDQIGIWLNAYSFSFFLSIFFFLVKDLNSNLKLDKRKGTRIWSQLRHKYAHVLMLKVWQVDISNLFLMLCCVPSVFFQFRQKPFRFYLVTVGFEAPRNIRFCNIRQKQRKTF